MNKSIKSDPGAVYVFERQMSDDDDADGGAMIWKMLDDVALEPVNDDVVDGTASWYLNETLRYFYFGSSIDVVGNVACVVSDYNPDGWGKPKVYIYHRRRWDDDDDGGAEWWEQIRRLDLNYPPSAKECLVGDVDTLAVQVDDYTVELYKYDDYEGGYRLIQTKIRNDWMESISFDDEYLIYSTKKEYDVYAGDDSSSPPIASTESPLPTLTCTPIYVILNLDDYPEEISWVVRKVNTIGTNDVLKVFNGTLEKDVQQKRKVTVCLSD